MSNYRQIHCRMWSSDNWFIELKPEMKLLFIYLFSNDRTSMCGLYELPIRIMSFETGLSREVITQGLEAFNKADKVKYDFETGVVWVKNAMKYQSQTNPNEKVRTRILADIKSVPDCALKMECLDMVSIGYRDGVDTIVSVSSSVLVEEGGGTGEGEIKIPETPAEAMQHPDIRLFEEVCDQFPGARDYESIIRAVQKLRAKHNGSLKDYLIPFWNAWLRGRTKDGKAYRKNNPAWLTEWAINGENPGESALTNGPAYQPFVPPVDDTPKSAPPPKPKALINALGRKMNSKKVLQT